MRKALIGSGAWLWLVLSAGLGACASQGSKQMAALPPQSAQYALELDWHYELLPNSYKPFAAAPLELGQVVEAGNSTYVASQTGRLLAIDNASAKARWDIDLEAPITAGPVVVGSAIFVALSSGSILKLQAQNGEILWRFESSLPIEYALSVAEGKVVAMNVNNRLYALSADDGSLIWRKERPRSQEFTMYGQAKPLISEGRVYAGFSDGSLHAYELDNGNLLWTRELAAGARFKDIDCPPLRVGSVLYVATASTGLFALDIHSGQSLWQRDILGISGLRGFQDKLYLSSQSGVYALDLESGQTIWHNAVHRDISVRPLQLGRKFIYVSVQRLGLVLIDRQSGQTRHVVDLGSDSSSAPFLGEGKLSFISNRSVIYRFNIDDKAL